MSVGNRRCEGNEGTGKARFWCVHCWSLARFSGTIKALSSKRWTEKNVKGNSPTFYVFRIITVCYPWTFPFRGNNWSLIACVCVCVCVFVNSGNCPALSHQQVPNTEALSEWNDDEARVPGAEVSGGHRRFHPPAEGPAHRGDEEPGGAHHHRREYSHITHSLTHQPP